MRLLLLAALLSLGAPATHAATARSDSGRSAVGGDIAAVAADAARIATAPFRFRGRDWATVGAIAGGCALVSTLDRGARAAARRSHTDAADPFMNVGREYGREVYAFSLAGGLYAGGLLFGDARVRTTGRMLLESVAFAGAANIVLKSFFGRSRPQAEEGPYRFRWFETDLQRTSLPSGHATVAFAVSSVLARRIDNPYASAGLYALAGLTAVSRVYHDNHWLSDTFLGAAIGTAAGFAVTGGDGEGEVSVAPAGLGARLTYRF